MSKKSADGLFHFFKTIFYCLSIITVLLTFIFRMVVVDGPSMNNTLNDKDRVIVLNYQFIFFSPKQGDIVAVAPDINSEKNPDKIQAPIIKRIIAVSGQTVGFDEETGDVYVDGKVIDEPYISSKTDRGAEWNIPDVIPEGKVFVMGDNRNVSLDSRSPKVGLVDEDQIIGKAIIRIFPLQRISYLY